MIPGARLVILGRQGAGKGTQCVRLARHYVVPHISTGDMLRMAVKEGTDFGRKAKEYMDAGELLPDDVMVGIVDERLGRDDTTNRGYILDGFPRTVGQAEALDGITDERGQPIDLVARPRGARGRSSSSASPSGGSASTAARTTRSTRRPGTTGPATTAAARSCQRDDDTEEAIRHRLELYDEQTAPLIAWYQRPRPARRRRRPRHPDEVTGRLVRAVDARTRGIVG